MKDTEVKETIIEDTEVKETTLEAVEVNNAILEETDVGNTMPEEVAVPTIKQMRKTVNHIYLWLLLYNVISTAIAAIFGMIFSNTDVYIMLLISTAAGTALLYLCTFKKWPVRPFARSTKKMTAKDFFTLYGVFCITSLVTVGVSIFTEAVGVEGTSIDMGSVTIWLLLYAVIVGPCVEELLYRGFAMGNGIKLGKIAAIVMSAFAFGLMHANLSQFLIGLLGGLVLGFIFVEYSIWWSLLIHVINNAMASIIMMLPEQYADIGSITELCICVIFAIYAIVQLVMRRGEIKAWFGDKNNHGPKGTVCSVLTSPWFIVFTLIYVAIIILFMVFPEYSQLIPETQ